MYLPIRVIFFSVQHMADPWFPHVALRYHFSTCQTELAEEKETTHYLQQAGWRSRLKTTQHSSAAALRAQSTFHNPSWEGCCEERKRVQKERVTSRRRLMKVQKFLFSLHILTLQPKHCGCSSQMKFRDLIVPLTNLLIDCFTSSQTPTSLFFHLFQEVWGKLFVTLLVYMWASLVAQC